MHLTVKLHRGRTSKGGETDPVAGRRPKTPLHPRKNGSDWSQKKLLKKAAGLHGSTRDQSRSHGRYTPHFNDT